MQVGDLVIRKVNYGEDKGFGLIVNSMRSSYNNENYFGVQFPYDDELLYYETKELQLINEAS